MLRTRAAAILAMTAALVVGIGCGSGAKPDSSSATVAPNVPGQASAAKKRGRAANWPTYHANLARTGVDTSSPALGQVHRAWSRPLDGSLYAEPLVVGSRVYVATENNTVYALNAKNGHVAWKRHLGTPVVASTLPCGNIEPVTGITGTPAISRNTLYVVAFLSGYRHLLFGLRLHGGKVRLKRNVDAPGSDPRVHQERSALSVANGRVYVPFGGLTGDCGDYKGRVVSVKTRGKPKRRVFTVGVHREGGIWAPSGAAVDSAGDLFVVTGNGDATSGFDFGNSLIRLSPKLKQADFYRASNSPQLNQTDTDLGSVGPTLLGGDRMFVIGKEGLGLILSAVHLGGTGGQLFSQHVCGGGAYGGLAFQAPLVYVPCTDGLYALRVSGDSFTTAWKAGGSAGPPIVAGGAVWTIDGSTLHAYAAATGGSIASFDLGSQATHFPSPAAAGGRLFAPGGNQLVAFAGV
ncbi:MAG TPA: PQQ-binding-like beta-propeller repeat protein [Solirubrobacterales bacterium]